ncbi:hypothetical protein HPB47_013834 [Ixodes persulcatus]|uniref:Uncharacterized protein n=1 Tax=Ixodes persulcatus TaxID=34615 RepID=A0AC60QXI0_IXOPE|nr:hypothetical protein HPB47_013834 [Ixodes persulcatus]
MDWPCSRLPGELLGPNTLSSTLKGWLLMKTDAALLAADMRQVQLPAAASCSEVPALDVSNEKDDGFGPARFLKDEEIAAILDESDADLSDAEDPDFCISAQDESGSGVHSDTSDQEVFMDDEDEHETPSPPEKKRCSWKEAT